MFKEYHKIQSVFKRDIKANKSKFLLGEFTLPEFELLKNCEWDFTEKVDGTNIRIHWDGESVKFGGRTDKAQIPASLYEVLTSKFTPALMMKVFGDKGGVTLYGEGYGNKIQKVGNLYIPDSVDFILFDIMANGIWFDQIKTLEMSHALEVDHVPLMGSGSIIEAIDIAQKGFKSLINCNAPAEGLIIKPKFGLRDRLGKRIITKIKTCDFKHFSCDEIRQKCF